MFKISDSADNKPSNSGLGGIGEFVFGSYVTDFRREIKIGKKFGKFVGQSTRRIPIKRERERERERKKEKERDNDDDNNNNNYKLLSDNSDCHEGY